MKIFFAADHAGFELKNILLEYVKTELHYDVEDCGAYAHDDEDDYPDFIRKAAQAVAEDPRARRAIILGGSGQGEAMAANRFKGVRAALYYGPALRTQTDIDGDTLDVLTSARVHNDANVLALGARFLTKDEARGAVRTWLTTEFSGDERHARRIQKIDG